MAALFKPRKHRAKHKYLNVEYKDGKWKYHYYERPLSRKKKITGSGKVNKSDLTVDEIQAVRIIKNEFDTALHGSWGKKKKKKSSLSSNAHKAKSKKVRVPKMSQLQHNAKGWYKPNHKYLNRIRGKNGKWIYYYDKEYNKNSWTSQELDKIEELDRAESIMFPDYHEEKQKKLKEVYTNEHEKYNDARRIGRIKTKENLKKRRSPFNRRKKYLKRSTKSINRRLVHNMNNELTHMQKGGQKQNHKYLDRKWLNGKWQYIYDNAKKAAGNAKKEFQAQTNSNSRVNTLRRAKLNKAKNDVSNKIASGRSKVNSIISQLKRQASGKVAGYKSAKQSKERQKRLNQINKQKQKSAKAFNKALKRTNTSVRNAAYETMNLVENYRNGTSDYKSASQIVKENEKKYKKRAQMQKRSKNKIAREQAVGKAKKAVTTAASNVVQTAKNTKNSYTNPYSRRNTLRNAKKRNKKKS